MYILHRHKKSNKEICNNYDRSPDLLSQKTNNCVIISLKITKRYR